ncbi:hypothetical protein EYR36_010236 [Pleurotus pulmonarius]|nr:hypothetical protein EYR36_010236 [Pleurotus pulmonarius]
MHRHSLALLPSPPFWVYTRRRDLSTLLVTLLLSLNSSEFSLRRDAIISNNIASSTVLPNLPGLTLTLTLYGVTLAQSLLYFRAYQGDKFYLKTVVLGVMINLISDVSLRTGYIIGVCTQFAPTRRRLVVFTLISVLELKPRFGHAIMDVVPRSFIVCDFLFLLKNSIDRSGNRKANFRSSSLRVSSSLLTLIDEQQAEDFGISDLDQFNLEAFIFMPRNVKLRIIQLCSSATCDLLITCSLVYLLRGQYQQVLSRLFCILTIIMWFASKDNLWLPFQLLSASFYTNSFLASLNSRSMVRQRGFSDGVNTSAELALTDLRKI